MVQGLIGSVIQPVLINRVFTSGFMYKLKVIDLQPDSIAITKVTELSDPYVKIRSGDEIWVEK